MNALIEALKSFPGVGKRSAERMAFAILKWPGEKREAVGSLISGLSNSVVSCVVCGNIADAEADARCAYCADPSRDASIICVVEEVAQISGIERGGFFRGLYHVLGGRLAPLEGKHAEDLNIESLRARIADGGVLEVILALGQDVEGRATAIYLADLLKTTGVKVSRLASGIPVGADLSYADSATIAAALNGRVPLD
ncbi:MAG: recombination protein RecR [Kiritimatiellaeota bacterium]|nr:recombination protein RecR [Kiritimatiellota bacterium]